MLNETNIKSALLLLQVPAQAAAVFLGVIRSMAAVMIHIFAGTFSPDTLSDPFRHRPAYEASYNVPWEHERYDV